MIRTVYTCDVCQQEKTLETLYTLSPYCISGERADDSVEALLDGRHICPECMASLFHKAKPAAVKKPKKVETATMGPIERDRRKKYALAKADEARVAELYRSGMEMEQISDEVMVTLAPISKFVQASGLAEERYGQHRPV